MAIDSERLSINGDQDVYTVPKTCKAGIVKEFGPNFKIVVEEIPVPEPGKCRTHFLLCYVRG
jgi:hypothetical protein